MNDDFLASLSALHQKLDFLSKSTLAQVKSTPPRTSCISLIQLLLRIEYLAPISQHVI